MYRVGVLDLGSQMQSVNVSLYYTILVSDLSLLSEEKHKTVMGYHNMQGAAYKGTMLIVHF